jgi:sugar lactone lactonase YvrE
MNRKTLLTVFALAFTGMIAWAQAYYCIYKSGAEPVWIASELVDSVKVEGESVNFYKANSLVKTLAIADIDSLVTVDYDDDAIRLLAPTSNGAIDLNTTPDVTFSWTLADGVEGYTLKLGTQADLSDAKNIYFSNVSRKTYTADEMYDYLTLLGIGYSLTDLYWTVEDTDGNVAAATPAKFKVRKRPKGILTTLAGHASEAAFVAGKLSETKVRLRARSLVIDGNNNILAFQRDNNIYSAILISEARDTVALRNAGANILVNNAVVDPATNIVYAGAENTAGSYWVYDPADNWKPKSVAYTGDIPTPSDNKHATGIAYHNGNLYLKYAGIANLYRVNLTSNVSEIVNTKIWEVQGMAIHPVNGKLYFTSINTSGGNKDGVYAVDLSLGADADPQPVALVNTEEANTFNTPERICFTADGTGYVVSRYGQRCIFMLTPDGAFIRVLGNGNGHTDGGNSVAQTNSLMGIAAAADGTLYVTESANYYGWFRKYTPHIPSEE